MIQLKIAIHTKTSMPEYFMVPPFCHVRWYLPKYIKIGKVAIKSLSPILPEPDKCYCSMSPLGLSALTAADNLWEPRFLQSISVKPQDLVYSTMVLLIFCAMHCVWSWGKAVDKMKREFSFYVLHILSVKIVQWVWKHKLEQDFIEIIKM